MPSREMAYTKDEQRQYYLITNVAAKKDNSHSEVNLDAKSWKLPYNIDDEDLKFDGKPLNMLYEENRVAEHQKGSAARDLYKTEKMSRGRSRQCKK